MFHEVEVIGGSHVQTAADNHNQLLDQPIREVQTQQRKWQTKFLELFQSQCICQMSQHFHSLEKMVILLSMASGATESLIAAIGVYLEFLILGISSSIQLSFKTSFLRILFTYVRVIKATIKTTMKQQASIFPKTYVSIPSHISLNKVLIHTFCNSQIASNRDNDASTQPWCITPASLSLCITPASLVC